MSCEKKGLQEVLKDFVLALSLANLWFFNVWRLFLISHSNSYPYYHWKAKAAPILLATVLDVLLLAVILWLATTIARRMRKPFLVVLARWVFLVMFFVTAASVLVLSLGTTALRRFIKNRLESLLLLFPSLQIETLYSGLWVVAGLVCLVLATMLVHTLVYKPQRVIRIATAVVLILSPFVLVTFSQATWQWMSYRSGEQFRDKTAPASVQLPNSRRRIIWILFDEMDYRLAFLNRPPTVELPEFDRLRSESIFANNAYPPGGDTVLSLPALINGRLISNSRRIAPNELMLTFADDNQSHPWSAQPNVFSAARAMGFNSGLAGWYHPYCRIIGNSLARCSWEPLAFLGNQEIVRLVTDPDADVTRSMLQVGKSAFPPDVIGVFLRSEDRNLWRKYTFQNYVNIHTQALAMASDPELQLVLIHYPIPHPPGIYDRSIDDFSFNSSSGYLDNLELADRALGELRRQLEQAGLWATTTVLISSDHRLRADRVWRQHPFWKPSVATEDSAVTNSLKDERVPFILKLAGEGRGVAYEAAFNTLLTHDLLLALLSGEASTHPDVVRWLDEHRSFAKSPYEEGEK